MNQERMTASGLSPSLDASSKDGWLQRLARKAVHGRLERLKRGLLHVVEGKAQASFGRSTPEVPLEATVFVEDPRFFERIALGGAVGAGEAYRDGLWRSDDLTKVLRILSLNRSALVGLEKGLARLASPVKQAAHWWRRNSREGSRRNIRAHYDLGNSFYSLFLDPTMTYSCGVFPDGADLHGKTDAARAGALELASVAKLDLICRKLELAPGDRVLEIGTGWGGFAAHAARHYGCRVDTTTISQEQFDFAKQRVRREGLTGRVTVLLEDYRDLQGRYDKLVSIEMIEAVGEDYLDDFFRVCSDRLEEHGMMALQAIVISDQVFESYRRGVDFIQRHIFPGCFLPSVGAIADRLARVTDLRLFHLQDITPHYATTLRLWRERFLDHPEELHALGFDDRFIRLWEFYFRYCEAGFDERVIGDVQLLLTKPMCRRQPLAF